jgi:spermidine synthase
MMLGSLYLQPQPGKILIIGLGGGSLPTALSQIFPKAEIDVIEIDPAVVRVARKYFSFQTDSRMKVFEEDGRVFVKRAMKKGTKYDLIMLDAFDHEYIPEHLLTREFLSEVKKILTPEGVMAANTWSGSRLYDHESATYESVFDRFFSLRKKSRVILAKNNGLPTMDTINKNAKALEARLVPFGVGSKYLLPLFSAERDWRPGARILTDQFSPSNLLNVR